MHHPFGRKAIGFAAAASAFILCSLSPISAQVRWGFSGGDLSNTRNAAGEKKITTANAGGLQKKWEFATAGDVSATPTVEQGEDHEVNLYVPDWAGYLYKVNGV